jgi:predicted O-methyltransferase YrrM
MNKEYKYTENWFASEDIERFLPKYTEEKRMLEIGSFEGKSTVWFLENILVNKNSTITCVDPWTSYSQNTDSFNSYNTLETEWDFTNHQKTFIYNIYQSGSPEKIIINKGFSYKILPKLINDNEKYDIIFIDGNHTSPFVLSDCVMSWYLLNDNGIMIFDDYLWGDINSTTAPKIAIDSFISCFKDYIEIIWSDYRLAIKKVK